MLVPFFAKARSKCQSHIRKGDTARITIKNYWAFTYYAQNQICIMVIATAINQLFLVRFRQAPSFALT